MNEQQVREQMRRNREEPPEWKLELLRRIDALAQMPGAVEVFRRHVQEVAESLVSDREAKDALPRLAEGESMSAAEYEAKYSVRDLFGPGPALTLPEKFFILAAFHDVLCEAERMAPIMEWDLLENVKDPRFPAFCMYRVYVDDCADRPDDKLQPDTLRRYVEEVGAELARQGESTEAEPVKGPPEGQAGQGRSGDDPWLHVKELAQRAAWGVAYFDPVERREFFEQTITDIMALLLCLREIGREDLAKEAGIDFATFLQEAKRGLGGGHAGNLHGPRSALLARLRVVEVVGPVLPKSPTQDHSAPADPAPNWSKPCSKTEAAGVIGVSTENISAYLREHPKAVKKLTRQKWQFDKKHSLFAGLP